MSRRCLAATVTTPHPLPNSPSSSWGDEVLTRNEVNSYDCFLEYMLRDFQNVRILT